MRQDHRSSWAQHGRAITLSGLLVLSMAIVAGCGKDNPPTPRRSDTVAPSKKQGGDKVIDLPTADQRLCTGIVILLDTSGSMQQSVKDAEGNERPKSQLAAEALARITDATAAWVSKNPDRTLNLGVFTFSSSVREALPMGAFDAGATKAAITAVQKPAGGTAIGAALQQGYKALYASGCVRKYIVCITDGENTSGPRLDRTARQLHGQTEGEVEMHFVAFDISASQFAFLQSVNGHVVEAADGQQLSARLSDIYEKRIFAEAMAEQ
jgi:uncharacterized protein YegL